MERSTQGGWKLIRNIISGMLMDSL
ncbi:unnamed protein product, partial [Vitis vinifera]